MLRDFKVLQYSFKEEITILPLSDLHLGASGCNLQKIKDTIKDIKDNPNCYTFLCGDIIDNGVKTGKGLGVYENVLSPYQQVQLAIELLEPIKDRILCIVSGNHEARSKNDVDINPLYMICCELGIQDRYRDALGVVKVVLGARKNNEGLGRCHTYTFLVHHGKGTSESAIKKDKEFINSFEDVDCIITGHTHSGRVHKYQKYGIANNGNVYKKDVLIVVCNSFLEDAEYALKSMMVGTSTDVISL